MKLFPRCLLGLFALSFAVSAQTLPKVTPQAPTSYGDVARYLNPDGSFYLYMSTEKWGAKLDEFAGKLGGAIIDNLEGEERMGAQVVLHFVRSFINESGLRAARGVGMSSVAEGKGLYHNRAVVAHAMPGPPKGLFWEMSTTGNGAFKMLDCIPEDAVIATYGPSRPAPLWDWVKKTIATSDFEPVLSGFNQAIMMTRGQGIDLDQWFESIGPGAGLVATISREEKVLVPLPTGVQLEVPQMALALLIEVKDDSIFQFIDTMLQAVPNVTRTDDGDLRLRSIQVPVPVPIRFKPTIARFGPYLVLATNDEVVQAMDSCRRGESPTIAKTPEFQTMAKGLPTEGMGFSFVSRRFGDNITGLIQAAMSADPETEVMAGFMGGIEGQASYAVSVKMPDAIVSLSRTNFDMGEVLVIQCAVVPGAIMAGMLLPALAQARAKARTISDINNLKQIGLGVFMYSDEHNGQLPNDLGDVWEYIGNNGKVFVSPAGKTTPPANAAEVRAGRCDYLYFGKGKKMAEIQNPSQTPMACTKPGLLKRGVNVAFCDGHVEGRPFIDDELKKLIQAAEHPAP
jgi:prepilin-type processing-associated H-X9-DG protein